MYLLDVNRNCVCFGGGGADEDSELFLHSVEFDVPRFTLCVGCLSLRRFNCLHLEDRYISKWLGVALINIWRTGIWHESVKAGCTELS